VKLWVALAVGVAALAAGPAAADTNECRGLNPCVAVAGPWVVVPVGAKFSFSRTQARYQLTCPRGWGVGGTDAELSTGAIDLAFLGTSGAPVSPGVTTSRTIVFVASYTGRGNPTPTFRPHIGCIPMTGGGRRTPTGVSAVVPPGQPTVRRVVTARVTGTKRIVAACRPGERLVDWWASSAFATQKPPPPALVASLTLDALADARSAFAVAHASRGKGIVQVAAVCAGGR
jgi:hypothetical protein